MSKAYRCFCTNEDHGQEIIFSETARKARRSSSNFFCDCSYFNRRANRAPEFDAHAPGPVPKQVLIDAGWSFECAGCGTLIRSCNSPLVAGDWVYCSRGCIERRSANPGEVETANS